MKKKMGMGLMAAAVLALAMLAGCGDQPGREYREVVMWTFGMGIDEWLLTHETDIEKRFNVDMVYELVPQNGFIQKLQAAMYSGENVPDIIEWMIENNRILNADPAKCFVLPLDEFVNKSKLWKQVPPGRSSWVTYGGHVYGLPHDVHPVILIYNDTLWKEAGVDLAEIETWDEFFAAALKLIAEKENGKPLHYALPSGDGGLGDSMWMIWQQTGAHILDREGRPQFNNFRFKMFLQKWLRWQESGVFTDWDWGNFGALLKNGTLCAYTSPDWWVGQVNAAVEDGAYEWRVRELPLYVGGNGARTSSWGGSFLAIPKTVKDPERIYEIIEYIQYGNPEILVSRYDIGGMLAPVAGIWDDPVFHQPDPRFGGQKLGELQTRHAMDTPRVNAGDVFWDAVADFNEVYPLLASGELSINEGLARVQETAEARLE